jgi:hypothetical protein
MNKEPKHSRTGIWIPLAIWELDLAPMDRVLLAEVASFQANNLKCFVTNEHLAELLGISEDRARKIIYRLIDKGHLKRGVVANGQGGYKRTLGWVQSDRGVGANGLLGGRKRTHTKPVLNQSTKPVLNQGKKVAVVLPWQTPTFETAWSEWKEYKHTDHRFKYKSPKTEQRALIELSNEYNDESEATDAIYRAIANGWKGLVFDTSKGGRANNRRANNLERDGNREKLAEFARTGRITPDSRNVL